MLAVAVFVLFMGLVRSPFLLAVGWLRGILALMTLLVIGSVGMTFLLVVLQQSRGSLPFELVVLALVYVLIPFVSFVKGVIDSDMRPAYRPVLRLMGFLVAETYLLILLGIFNSQHVIMPESGAAAQAFTLMHHGAQHLFSFPAPGAEGSVIPFLQFLIGFVFNVLTVGFFTSYVSSLFSSESSH